jgi:hypothetical protein
MSDVLVTATGEIFFKIDSQIAALLMAAFPASFERVNGKPKLPAPVSQAARFYVGKNLLTEKVQLMFQQGSVEEWYDGPAEHAHRAFGKRQVPADVIAQYAAALEQEKKDNSKRLARR